MRKHTLDNSEAILILVEYSVRFFVIDEHGEGDCKDDGDYDAGNNEHAQVDHVFLLFGFLTPGFLNLGHLVWTVLIHELAEVAFGGMLF